MENLSLLIAVSAIDFLNFSEKKNLFGELTKSGFSDEEPLLFLEKSSYGQIESLSKRDKKRPLKVKRWDGAQLVRLAKKSALESKALGIKCLSFGQELYPPLLKEICDPPFSLFYRGEIKALFSPCVSVVGTRRLSPEGREASRVFSYQAASAGLCVVSGLAIGADGQAHQGAVDAFFDGKSPSCKTAAVLAGGVDNVFPACHKNLAARIIQNGGVILSECPPGVPGQKWRFVSRNRIIASLSPATLVVQAPPGSGAMLTADFALDYNRDLFFHEACFCKSAKNISSFVFRQLQAKKGAEAEKKLLASPDFYARDGAPVLSSFLEFANFYKNKESYSYDGLKWP